MGNLTWSEYVDEAVKTAPEQPPKMQLAQAALGLVGETEEVRHTADVIGEMGDCYWYLALAYNALLPDADIGAEGIPLRDGTRRRSLGVCVTELCEEVEAFVFQEDDNRDTICRLLESLYDALGRRAAHLDRPDIWEHNLEKLRDRHGDSFSPADEQKR